MQVHGDTQLTGQISGRKVLWNRHNHWFRNYAADDCRLRVFWVVSLHACPVFMLFTAFAAGQRQIIGVNGSFPDLIAYCFLQ